MRACVRVFGGCVRACLWGRLHDVVVVVGDHLGEVGDGAAVVGDAQDAPDLVPAIILLLLLLSMRSYYHYYHYHHLLLLEVKLEMGPLQ